jgi:hypothetical protein
LSVHWAEGAWGSFLWQDRVAFTSLIAHHRGIFVTRFAVACFGSRNPFIGLAASLPLLGRVFFCPACPFPAVANQTFNFFSQITGNGC